MKYWFIFLFIVIISLTGCECDSNSISYSLKCTEPQIDLKNLRSVHIYTDGDIWYTLSDGRQVKITHPSNETKCTVTETNNTLETNNILTIKD